jgi:hypothetical protein
MLVSLNNARHGAGLTAAGGFSAERHPGSVVHKQSGLCQGCDKAASRSTFPQFFFSMLLMEKLYFGLIKVSPSRAQARCDGLARVLGQAHAQTYPQLLWISGKQQHTETLGSRS